jgi:hypothetical protein
LLVWALVIGFLIWGDVPTFGLLVGSSIVVAYGLFLLQHDAQRRRPAQSTTTAGESVLSGGSSKGWVEAIAPG